MVTGIDIAMTLDTSIYLPFHVCFVFAVHLFHLQLGTFSCFEVHPFLSRIRQIWCGYSFSVAYTIEILFLILKAIETSRLFYNGDLLYCTWRTKSTKGNIGCMFKMGKDMRDIFVHHNIKTTQHTRDCR